MVPEGEILGGGGTGQGTGWDRSLANDLPVPPGLAWFCSAVPPVPPVPPCGAPGSTRSMPASGSVVPPPGSVCLVAEAVLRKMNRHQFSGVFTIVCRGLACRGLSVGPRPQPPPNVSLKSMASRL